MARRQPGSNSFDELADLARTGGAGLHDAMMRAQCDLFAQQGAEGAARDTFVTLMLGLMPRVAHATLLAAARRIAPLPETPAAVLEALFEDGGSVAATIIELAPNLPPALRSRALNAEDPRLGAMFAARHDLTEPEQDQLVMRGETVVLRTLARRTGSLSRAATASLLDAARGDDQLAAILLARPEIDATGKLPLYRFASPAQRVMIRDTLDRRVAERLLPSPVRVLGNDDVAGLMALALEGIEPWARRAAELGGQGPAFVTTMMQDESREIVTLLLLSLGVSAEDGVRMLLRTGDAVARDSRALAVLVDILREGTRLMAHAVLAANWPATAPPRKATHQPVMVDGGTPSRAPATVGQRRVTPAALLDKLRNPRAG